MVERTLCPILVGREDELSSLEDALLGAARGSGRVAVLGGEAGLGKTRLATELRRRAEKIGCAVLWGSCSETDLALPYLPFVEAIGSHLSINDVAGLRHRLGASARVLATVFPQLGLAARRDDAGDPAHARLRLFEAVLALVRVVAEERPVLLVLEDLHWADASTRDLLDYVARRLQSTPIVILVTYRQDETRRGHPLLTTIQSWHRSRLVDMVQLMPLTAAQVGSMVAAIFDEDDVSAEFRDYLHRRTEGNPFVLEEMLKEAVDSGDIFRTEAGWDRRAIGELNIPQAVADSILMRVERLAPNELAVVQAAAILGRTFSIGALTAMTQLEDPDLESALTRCIAEQLFERGGDGHEHLRFRHALTTEAVYEAVLPRRRQGLHLRAARAMQGSNEPLAEVARHLVLGGRPRDAVPLYLQAGDNALAAHAAADAADLYERALPHITDRPDRGRVLSRLGEARWQCAALPAAQAALDEAVALLEETQQPASAAHARLLHARCSWERGKATESLRQYEAVRVALEALGPSEDLAVLYLRLALHHCTEWAFEAAMEMARRAIAVAETAGCDSLRVWGHTYLGMAMCQRGDVDEGLRTIDQSADEAVAREYYRIAKSALFNGVNQRMYAVRTAEMPPALTRCRALPGYSPSDEVWTLGYLARFHLVRGDLVQSLTCIDAADELARQTGQRSGAILLDADRGWIRLERDQLDSARAVAPRPEQFENAEDQRESRWVRIAIELADGDIVAAAAIARDVEATGGPVAPWLSEVAVEALMAAGKNCEAERLLCAPNHFGHPGREPFHLRARGRVALGGGDTAEAVLCLATARDRFETAEDLLQELRTRLVLARALASAGDTATAGDELLRVVERAEPRALTRLCRLAREYAVELDIAMPPPREPTHAEPPVPEREIAVETPAGERLVTVMFADVRGYTAMTAQTSPADLADRIAALQRWAAREVARQHGVVDKFAGDAVMATFNVSGATVDHCVHAVEAAIALRDKAALLDLHLGIGVAVGPAVVGTLAPGANLSVLGEATNLAARLQSMAGGEEILLSAEAHRRTGAWLREHRIDVAKDRVTVRGLEEPVDIVRISPRGGAPRRQAAQPSAWALVNALRWDGEMWTVVYAGRTIRLKDRKGLRDLAHLLAAPRTPVPAVELAYGGTPAGATARRDAAAAGLGVEGGAGPVIDSAARRQYRERLRDLDCEIAEADASHDPERAARVREEREFLLAELTAAVGLGGRERGVLDPAERARKAVTMRIREAVTRVGALHAELGEHLRRSLRTGALCTYDPPQDTTWSILTHPPHREVG